MRKPIIAGNWKMNMTPAEAKELITELIPLVKDAACDVVVCPPFVAIPVVAALIKDTNIRLGAQNVHWAAAGAYTGEISARMLSEAGVDFAIIGHSERREYFGETNKTVNARAKAAIEGGITPIICVGETLGQREAGETKGHVSSQIQAAFEGISADDAREAVVAYEPIWAIGTGKTATAQEANDTIRAIRGALAERYGEETAKKMRIQYGGSMNAKNAAELMAMPEIDGGLIGGASLKAVDFAQIVHS